MLGSAGDESSKVLVCLTTCRDVGTTLRRLVLVLVSVVSVQVSKHPSMCLGNDSGHVL